MKLVQAVTRPIGDQGREWIACNIKISSGIPVVREQSEAA